MKHSIDCIDFKPLRRGTLVGFADIVVRELKLTIRDVALHRKGESRWISPPGRPWIKDGAVVVGEDGKIQYSQILEFANKGTRDAFGQVVWRAVEAFDPESVAP
jgi:hypothetical protein